MTQWPLISLLTGIPLAGALVVFGLGADRPVLARRLGMGVALLALAGAGLIYGQFDPSKGAIQLVDRYPWITGLGVDYHVGVDGLGLLMLLLTALVVPMALAASGGIRERVHTFVGLVLVLESGLFGTFTALNFFHWFLFWELSLIPAFFLIKLWGGPGRSRAAIQFFVYTMVGSITLLLSFLAIYLATGIFDFAELSDWAAGGRLTPEMAAKLGWAPSAAAGLSLVLMAGAMLGVAVKVPMMPFHTWLPGAYSEAPASVTMLLTAVMSKMGVYALVRIILPIFPDALRQAAVPLLWLAVATIVFSAAAALAQRDLRRMLAYSSINHLGYCLLAVIAVTLPASNPGAATERAAALSGAFLQMFNHGLTAAVLFWFMALLEQRSGGLRGLDDFGGLRARAPVFCGLMGIALFSSLGLPGLNGFVGEFLIFKGVFPLAGWAAAVSTLGLLFTALFILTLLQRVFFGPANPRWAGFEDLTATERLWLTPAFGLMLVLGVYPRLLLDPTNATVIELIRRTGF